MCTCHPDRARLMKHYDVIFGSSLILVYQYKIILNCEWILTVWSTVLHKTIPIHLVINFPAIYGTHRLFALHPTLHQQNQMFRFYDWNFIALLTSNAKATCYNHFQPTIKNKPITFFMPFPPASCISSLSPKYSPMSCFRHISTVFKPIWQQTNFMPIHYRRYRYSFKNIKLYA